jgi:hypothetical protein
MNVNIEALTSSASFALTPIMGFSVQHRTIAPSKIEVVAKRLNFIGKR